MGKRAPTYRSSWEYTFASFCDNNPAVIQWTSEGLRIPYKNPVTGRNTVYVPDFLIVYVDKNQQKHTELIEIKPTHESTFESARTYKDKLSVAINMAKWAAADAWCRTKGIRFRVVTEADIFHQGSRR